MKILAATNGDTIMHFAFTDCAANSENFILAIATAEKDRAKIDVLIERRPPFVGGPAQVIRDFAKLLRQRGITTVMGPRHSSGWVLEGFSRAGISYEFCALRRPDLHRDFLKALADGKIDLPQHDLLAAQLLSVRHPAKDHGQHGDDVLTAVAGATLSALGSVSAIVPQKDYV